MNKIDLRKNCVRQIMNPNIFIFKFPLGKNQRKCRITFCMFIAERKFYLISRSNLVSIFITKSLALKMRKKMLVYLGFYNCSYKIASLPLYLLCEYPEEKTRDVH